MSDDTVEQLLSRYDKLFEALERISPTVWESLVQKWFVAGFVEK